jgi:hypothetical protein
VDRRPRLRDGGAGDDAGTEQCGDRRGQHLAMEFVEHRRKVSFMVG